MKHFMAHLGPAFDWPWTKFTDVPEFTNDLVDLITSQADRQSGHLSIRELECQRDDNLVGIMRAVKVTGTGAEQSSGSTKVASRALMPQSFQ